MKKIPKHLPKEKWDELKAIVKYITTEVEGIEMVILFGSYATGQYVDYDQRIEFEIRTFFMSDYDILVLSSPGVDRLSVQQKLGEISDRFYRKQVFGIVTPISFITKSMTEFNKAIRESQFFYTDIKKEGYLLYDRKNYKIEPIKKLNFTNIRNNAEHYKTKKIKRGDEFLETAKIINEKKMYELASFQLHQAAENYLHAIILVYSLHSPKEHNLSQLFSLVKRYTDRLIPLFNRKDREDNRLFELLESAYIQSRYNFSFIVKPEDILLLIPKIEQMQEITTSVCENRIKVYDARIKKSVK